MRTLRTLRLGRVVIDGDEISFELDPAPGVELAAREAVRIGLEYDYRERSALKDGARVRIAADVDGVGAGSAVVTIGDTPFLDDSRVGFLALDLPGLARGTHAGRFRAECEYAITYGDGTQAVSRASTEGTFTVDVD